MATHTEAKKTLKKAKTLHTQANVLEERRRAKLDERNQLLISMELEDTEAAWFSITEVARELGVTFGAIKKIVKGK